MVRGMTARSARRVLARAAAAVVFAALAPSVQALGLLEAYDAALTNDPAYNAARKELEAGEQNRVIGRSYLLPKLSASYSNSRNWLTNTEFSNGKKFASDSRYSSYNGSIVLRQPLFDWEAISRYRYGSAIADASEATFDSRSQEILVRVLLAYTETLFTLDQLTLAVAQKRAYDEQLVANRRLLENGEGTRTDLLETEARAQIADADLINARDEFDNAAQALQALTGIPVTPQEGLVSLPDDFKPVRHNTERLDDWLQRARDLNPELISGRHSLEAARQQTQIQRAGHLPRVNLVGSIGQSESDTVNALNRRYETKAVGIEVAIPLYAGGMVQGSTRQAYANYERAQFELQDRTNQVMLEVRKQYNLYASSMARIGALERAVESATLLITATRKSVAGGLRTNVDVLNAERQMYESRRDLSRARYQFLQASMQLKYAAGTLTQNDMIDMATLFRVPRVGDEIPAR
ncbi:TolC family outer membrane protein [Paracidovorax citrulli]